MFTTNEEGIKMNNLYDYLNDYILPDKELSAKAIKAKILSYFDDEKSFTAACEEIAKLMNVVSKTVQRWCTVSPPTKLDTLIKLSYILNCDIKELYVCKSQYVHPEFGNNDINNNDTTSDVPDSTLTRIKWKDEINKKYHIKDLQTLLRYIGFCDRRVLENVISHVCDYSAPVIDDYILRQMERIRMAVPEEIREDIDKNLYYYYAVPAIWHPVFESEKLSKEGLKYFKERLGEKTIAGQMYNIKNANLAFENDCNGLRSLYLSLTVRRPTTFYMYDEIFLAEFKSETQRMLNHIERYINNNQRYIDNNLDESRSDNKKL